MARKYQYAEGLLAWSMEEPEERWFIALYSQIANNIPNDHRWKYNFETYFFQDGTGVGESHINEINGHRVRLSLRPIALRETNVHGYARSSDRAMKAQTRRDWRDEYAGLDINAQENWIKQCEVEMANMEPPHRTLEEYLRDREQDEEAAREDQARTRERTRRVQALDAARQSQARPILHLPAVTESKTIRQLRLAVRLPDAESLLSEIIGRVDPETALDLAEELDDVLMQTALLRRSLDS